VQKDISATRPFSELLWDSLLLARRSGDVRMLTAISALAYTRVDAGGASCDAVTSRVAAAAAAAAWTAVDRKEGSSVER